MRPRLVLLLLLCVPFLMADSCVKQVFVQYEYELTRCPPAGFELPQNVRFAGWELVATEAQPYCHGYTRYEIEELKDAGVFSEPIKGAVVYARLLFENGCRLSVISSLSCNARETIEECEARMPYHGALCGLRASANDYTDVVAQRLLLGQKFSTKVPAKSARQIGRSKALEDWCAKL